MSFLDFLKSIVYGIVEGITEWMPVSSTGHLILLEKLLPLNCTAEYMEVFLVVIQLGAIMAVVLMYWKRIWPFPRSRRTGKLTVNMDIFMMWVKVAVTCIPAVFIGLFLDDLFNELFYNYLCVAIALIVFGIAFIIVENMNKGVKPVVRSIHEMSFKDAIIIGLFQCLAAIFPGTSRSGATILGALLIGINRKTAAEYTFFLAIPVMIGASGLKLVKYGFHFTFGEIIILLTALVVAFIVSVFAIKFLMSYIKKHDFKIFGYYRIGLGIIVLLFAIFA